MDNSIWELVPWNFISSEPRICTPRFWKAPLDCKCTVSSTVDTLDLGYFAMGGGWLLSFLGWWLAGGWHPWGGGVNHRSRQAWWPWSALILLRAFSWSTQGKCHDWQIFSVTSVMCCWRSFSGNRTPFVVHYAWCPKPSWGCNQLYQGLPFSLNFETSHEFPVRRTTVLLPLTRG